MKRLRMMGVQSCCSAPAGLPNSKGFFSYLRPLPLVLKKKSSQEEFFREVLESQKKRNNPSSRNNILPAVSLLSLLEEEEDSSFTPYIEMPWSQRETQTATCPVQVRKGWIPALNREPLGWTEGLCPTLQGAGSLILSGRRLGRTPWGSKTARKLSIWKAPPWETLDIQQKDMSSVM